MNTLNNVLNNSLHVLNRSVWTESIGQWNYSTDDRHRLLPAKPATDYACSLFFFILPGVLACIVCLAGLVGNSLSLVVISRLGRGSITFNLLAVLATVDLLFLTCYLLSNSLPDILMFMHSTPEVYLVSVTYTRYGLYPVAVMMHTASVWITTLVTTYRWVQAKHLIRQGRMCSRAAVYAQVVVILVFAILYEVPVYLEKRPVMSESAVLHLEQTELYYDQVYQLVYKNLLSLILRRLLPLTITVVMVHKRLRLLEAWRRRRLSSFNMYRLPNNQDRISRVLIAQAIIFVTCQLPGTIYPVFRLIFDIDHLCGHFYFYFAYVADFFIVLNSALTVYIFHFFIPQFKAVIKNIFCRSTSAGRRPSRDILETCLSHVSSDK